jgi:hypothetical protein
VLRFRRFMHNVQWLTRLTIDENRRLYSLTRNCLDVYRYAHPHQPQIACKNEFSTRMNGVNLAAQISAENE